MEFSAVSASSSSSDSADGKILIEDLSSSDGESSNSHPRRRFMLRNANREEMLTMIRRPRYRKMERTHGGASRVEKLNYHGRESDCQIIGSAARGNAGNLDAESSHRQVMDHSLHGLDEHATKSELGRGTPNVDEAIAQLLSIFPGLHPDQAASELLKTWEQFSVETALRNAIDHFLNHGVPVPKMGDQERAEVGGKKHANSAIPLVKVGKTVTSIGVGSSIAGPSHTSGEQDDCFELQALSPSRSEDLYRDWCYQRLCIDFPLVKMSDLRRAFKAHNRSLSLTYKAIKRACKNIHDSGKEPAKEETSTNVDLQIVNWPPKGGLSLMKTPRCTNKNEPNTICRVFEKEWDALQKDLFKQPENLGEVADKRSSGEEYQAPGHEIECGCCCCEFPFEKMVQCADGHLFCFECLRRHVEESTFGGLQAQNSLPCMDTSGCKESIPLSEVRRTLPHDVIERYEQRQAQVSVARAELAGLVYCPFCNFPFEVDEGVRILECLNEKCGKASCIQCKEPSHVPLRCEEVEKKSETALRRQIEEMMTKAVIRECTSCKAELVKMDGCNKVTCRCGKIMCYVCRKNIFDYSHFCEHAREPGTCCQICNKCSLWAKEVEDDVATAAKEAALKEMREKNLNLYKRTIGPPIKKKRGFEENHGLQYMPVGNAILPVPNQHVQFPHPGLYLPGPNQPLVFPPPPNVGLPDLNRVPFLHPANANLPGPPPFYFHAPLNDPHVFMPNNGWYQHPNEGNQGNNEWYHAYGPDIQQRDL